MAYIYHKI